MSEPTIYWFDPCNSLTGWVDVGSPLRWYYVYTGDSHEGGSCLQLVAQDDRWSWDGHSSSNAGKATLRKTLSGVVIPAQDGMFRFVIGYWLKIKQQNGGIGISARNVAGVAIGGVGYSPNGILYLYGQYATSTFYHPIPTNTWVNIEAVISPQKGELYVNGVKIGEDTNTRLNEPPATVEVSVVADAFNGTSEIYADTIYLAENPQIAPQEYYQLSISAGGGGTTDPAPGDYQVLTTTIVSLQAIPTQEGYGFDHWTLNGVVYTANPLIFLMDRSYVAQAIFNVPGPPERTITLIAHDNGTITPSPGTYTYVEGQQFLITAYGNTGYVPDYWTVNGSRIGLADPYHYAHTVQGDATIEVFFKIGEAQAEFPWWLIILGLFGIGIATSSKEDSKKRRKKS